MWPRLLVGNKSGVSNTLYESDLQAEQWAEQRAVFLWSFVAAYNTLHYKIICTKALWCWPPQSLVLWVRPSAAGMIERVQDQTLASKQAGHLSKIFRGFVNLGHLQATLKVAVWLFLKKGSKINVGKKSLINSRQSNLLSWSKSTLQIHWVHATTASQQAMQPVAMATWRWRQAEWGWRVASRGCPRPLVTGGM